MLRQRLPETPKRVRLFTPRIINGDCRRILFSFDKNSIDAVVTDPPYHLTTNKAGGSGMASLNINSPAGRARIGTGFMGQAWDGGNVSFQPSTWRDVWQVMKPGAHLIAFGGTRTYHKLATAIEAAGFEIRDQIDWIYGSGFPKSLNLESFCLIETRQEFEGWGTALKPAKEPCCLARKPLSERTVEANVLRWGTGALNIDASRISSGVGVSGGGNNFDAWRRGENKEDRPITHGKATNGHDNGRWPANVVHDGSDELLEAFAASTVTGFGNVRTAARFFYAAKASKHDRAGSKHPTIKPVSLLRYLVRLITPSGGIVLDPFCGTGTTLEGARLEGFNSIGIDNTRQWYVDACARFGITP